LAPSLGLISLEFRRDFWHHETRVPPLLCDVVYMILGLAVFVELRFVIDGQTDRQTDDDSLYRASIARTVKGPHRSEGTDGGKRDCGDKGPTQVLDGVIRGITGV